MQGLSLSRVVRLVVALGLVAGIAAVLARAAAGC